MTNQMSFSIPQRKSDKDPLRVGDAFAFHVNGSFGLSIVCDFEDKPVGFTLIPKSSEVVFGELSKHYSVIDKVIRIEYQGAVNNSEVHTLISSIYKKLSLGIPRKLFIECLLKAVVYRKDFQREPLIPVKASRVKKLPFIAEGYDLEGLSSKQLKKLRSNIYSVIKGSPATPEDMAFIGYIKKALAVQRDPRAELL